MFSRKTFQRIMIVWMIALTIIVIFMVTANRQRIDDIQTSRINSCRATYRSFPEMFKPFFPPNRSKWTDKQEADWNKLQNRATELASKCKRQTN